MKNVIKIIIALVVILTSYFIGFNVADESSSEKINALKKQIERNRESFNELQDNFTLKQKQLAECKSKKYEILKLRIVNSSQKK